MPVIGVAFPANAQYLYSFLISIASFDVVPTERIEELLFRFENESAMTYEFELLDIFIFISIAI